MPPLSPGQTVETGTPDFVVDALPPGTYRFRLEVVDQAGNVSLPVDRVVTVFAPFVAQPVPGTTVPLQPQVATRAATLEPQVLTRTAAMQPQVVNVQPQPAVVSPTPQVTATPITGIRFPTATLRAATLRVP